MATSIDPREIFQAAEQFNAAGVVLIRASDLALPLSVTHAFALELYLKSLLLIETGVSARGHNLLTLFEQLPGASQAEIEAVFAREELPACRIVLEKEQLPFSYRGNLALAADMFEKFRYQYELTDQQQRCIGTYLLSPLQRVIIHRQPGWRLDLRVSYDGTSPRPLQGDGVFDTFLGR
jgi:HEPN domain-containing protein